ncbi:hypothetical protein OKW21_004271 [Catalinimonas alkaloidigena]|nr:hypothetical protein [Catalinimonas alkaloidigena]MDF9799008.1 hypothetical protein [Catalinimonas alkaloidigena]
MYAISALLLTDIFTADFSAHAFDSTLYLYPSHDIGSGISQDDTGSHA